MSTDNIFSFSSMANSTSINSTEYAMEMDAQDELKDFKDRFCFPSAADGKHAIYLCGNSLGLQPKGLRSAVVNQLDKWAAEGVEGHFEGSTPWLDIDDIVSDSIAKLVGANKSEVVMMNSLTCNLHLMMTAFYRPTGDRFKIMMEKKAFPSDYHAIISQIQVHGLDPRDALIEVGPREGETILRQEDIELALAEHGPTVALVLFSGVQYYTGQLFDLAAISSLARAQGCKVGFDLAHAVGNVPLRLHEWGCDFACWCTYKYMNCGPGCLGGCFVHERHGGSSIEISSSDNSSSSSGDASNRLGTAPEPLRLAGWWGHRREDRFLMEPHFIPCIGANGFRLSNPPVLLIACIRASLDLFDEAGMDRLRRKSVLLTGYLEALLKQELRDDVVIFTPSDQTQRGCQLSLSFPMCSTTNATTTTSNSSKHVSLDDILDGLKAGGIICDARKPDVIRIAPVPLYNTFSDVFSFVSVLKKTLQAVNA